jgi:hypothetical protein
MRKKFIQIVGIIMLLFMSKIVFSQNIITVTDCNLNGWVKQPIGKSTLGFVSGPATPALGKGSIKFNVPAGGIFWPGDFVRFRNGQYSGTPFSSLTELSFSTFIEVRDTIADIHFLVILSDINGDGSAEHNLVFDPRYQKPPFIRSTMPNQGNTIEHVWQTWSVLNGGWFFGGTTETDPDHNGPYFTLSEYLSLYPNATIRNDASKGGPAIRLSAGGVVFKPNFYGSMDNFKIGINGVTTTYDFEFTTANAGTDKNTIYGYGSNCITLTGTAAGGVAPYTYAWSPGGENPNQASTTVCPIVTTTYTLMVTDKNGCTRTDDVTVIVNDVRCGSKMDKVKLCHNDQEICVAKESVTAHLQHGDKLGSCGEAFSGSKTQPSEQNELREQSRMKLYNYPNPFTNTTRIIYELPYDGKVSIKVYDLAGKEVDELVNANKKEGQHSIDFTPEKLPGGIYYYKLTLLAFGKQFTQTAKLLVTAQ